MGLWVLDLIFRNVAVRGHVPHDGNFGAGRDYPSSPVTGRLARVLAVCLISVALLSLIVWAVVWLTIQLL